MKRLLNLNPLKQSEIFLKKRFKSFSAEEQQEEEAKEKKKMFCFVNSKFQKC